MNRDRFRLAPRAIALICLACWIAAARGPACGQEGAEPVPPRTISPDEPMDRVSRIEARLRELETHNQQLQNRYDDLARKYTRMLQQSQSPIFGAEVQNPDGKGVPGGLNLGLSNLKGDKNGSEEEEEEQLQSEG